MKNHHLIKLRILTLLVLCSVGAFATDPPTLTLRKNDQVIKILTISELLQIKNGSVSVTVDNPTDSKEHTYDGISLPVLLERFFGNTWETFDLVKFITVDGYQPVIPTKKSLQDPV